MTDSNVIQLQKKFKILLLGDDCVDIYKYGTVDRISPEAPVPIIRNCRTEKKPGMAGNVKKNLENLGCVVRYVCGETSTKTRLIDEKSMQHIVRIDQDVISEPIKFDFLNLSNYDAIVISDYDKGAVTSFVIRELRTLYDGPIFVDTKKQNLSDFEGCFVKINQLEYSRAKTYCSDLIVTLGEKGVMYKNKKYKTKQVNVTDVCGAGDTFLAALTYKYLESKNIDTAIQFAIAASCVTVQHVGTYAPTLEEICD